MAAPHPELVIYPAISTAALRLMPFAASLVTAQPFLDVGGGLIGAVIWIGRHAFRFKQRARIQMQHELGAEPESILADGGMARIAAAEIFGRGFLDAPADPLTQRGTDADVPARNAQGHEWPPLTVPANAASLGLLRQRSMRRQMASPRPACRAGAAPRTGYAWLPGIWRQCGARCRCLRRAASRRWCRRTARPRRFRRQSSA